MQPFGQSVATLTAIVLSEGWVQWLKGALSGECSVFGWGCLGRYHERQVVLLDQQS